MARKQAKAAEAAEATTQEAPEMAENTNGATEQDVAQVEELAGINKVLEDEGLMTLSQVQAHLGIGAQRVRALVRSERLHTVKHNLLGTLYRAEDVQAIASDEGRPAAGTRAPRSADGRKVWLVRLNADEYKQLKEQGFEMEPRFNYDPAKAKEYRARRQARLATEAAAPAPAVEGQDERNAAIVAGEQQDQPEVVNAE